MPHAEGILVPGQDAAAYVMKYGADPSRIHQVRYGLPVQTWDHDRSISRPQRNSLRAELGLVGTAFLNVGRLWRGKGLEYLIDAFALLESTHRGKVSLLLVGTGPEEARLRQQARRLGCERVSIHAHVRDNALLAAIYSATDVFVFPSLGDPYGLVLDEAMACHLPVIASADIAEVHSRVREGANGFIVPARDSAAIADRMQRFVENPELAIRMGERSSEIVAQNTIEGWAQDFEQAVEQIALVASTRR
jgi:glycosyltransferase involved in cell wall biosynthesis